MYSHHPAPIGFTTSVDLAQRQQYSVGTVHGIKRPHVQLASEVHVLPERQSLHQTSNNTLHAFKRPRIEVALATESRLRASEIREVNPINEGSSKPSAYTQRVRLASTPGVSQNPLLSLSHPSYSLPDTLVRNFAALGIKSIYPWQSSCLLGRGLLTGEKNLVYTAPTGGGKSLVADVMMLKRVIEGKKAMLVLPYVALVQEKLNWLRQAVEGVEKRLDTPSEALGPSIPMWRKNQEHRSIRVVGFFGGSRARNEWTDVDIAVCTIEKANSMINKAVEEGNIGDLGIVVLDELHMVHDEYRGYLMELMTTKLLCMQRSIQIVGMSATLSNTEVLARWLDAKYYQSKYRPIPIEEYLVYDNSIYPVSTSSSFFKTASQLNSTQSKPIISPVRAIVPSKHIELANPVANAVISLAVETAKSGYGALIFCSSRLKCQTTAALLSEAMPAVQDDDLLDRRKEVLSSLRSLPVGLDEVLEKTIIRGVAFHHAGLTTEERDIVSGAFDCGVLKAIVATCSLAAGINLPARRVILQGARMGRDLIGPAMLRQMRGRAGRKGKDEIGESYICCQKDDLEDVANLLEADLPPVESCLTSERRGIKRALLEVIVVRLATHRDAIQDYIRRTLLYHIEGPVALDSMVEETIEDLCTTGMVNVDRTGTYEATLLGQATVISSLTPEDGSFVHSDFQRALRAFVMDGEMHIFYMFTPVQPLTLGDINWPIFRREMDGLDESGLRVLGFAGVNPALVNRMANSGKSLPENTAQEKEISRIYRRFYAAFQLRDLCNEVPIHAVARKYEMQRGFVQNLAQTCDGFAAGMIAFCERMNWGMLRSVLIHMSDRLKAGAKADLLELAKIPFVKSRTARIFWENGLKGLRAVAEAEARNLVPILLLAQPKKSKINGDEEAKYQQKLMLKAEIIISAASRLWERQQLVEIEAEI
ncbi:MAG: hypothetical protein Q9187_006922 [Circinaria calcarea]